MTDVVMQGQAGPRRIAAGSSEDVRLGLTAEVVVSEAHGRYYEPNYQASIFSDGMGVTSISNATFTVGGIGATTTPVTGVWNPSTSPVNLVILQATLGVIMTALQATGGGPFVWASSVGNAALTLGSTPLNRKTLVASGSFAKGLSGVALTGITNPLTVKFGSALSGGSSVTAGFLATQAGAQTQVPTGGVENFDGALIVPPGGVLALLIGTTPVAHSAASSLVWEEVLI